MRTVLIPTPKLHAIAGTRALDKQAGAMCLGMFAVGVRRYREAVEQVVSLITSELLPSCRAICQSHGYLLAIYV